MITLDGQRVVRAVVHVPYTGAWFADVDMETAPEVTGRVVLRLPGADLSGTVAERESGSHALERRLRLVGGAGGWGTVVSAQHYHNDAQVRARLVADDAARLAGETIGDFAPAAERVGVDYVRQAGPASRVLEDVIGGVPWWVGYDGTTHVGERAEGEPGAHEVLGYDGRERTVHLTTLDVAAVQIGTRLTERLDAPQTVRGLRIEVSADRLDVMAWTGEARRGRLDAALRAYVERVIGSHLWGRYVYRVSQMTGDRVELQAVRRRPGLPDMLPLSQWPGVAGAHASLTPGAHVLVEFVEGDRTRPIVTAYAGKDGTGWAPSLLTLDAETRIDLGAGASIFVALADYVDDRLGSIQSTFDGHIHTTTATVGTGPAGVISPPTSPIGSLASVAASKVRAE